MITHDPPPQIRTGELRHPAPTLGENAQAHKRVRMTNVRRGEPALEVTSHATPRQGVALAAREHVFARTDSCAHPAWLSSTSALASFEESLQVAISPLLPPGPSRRYLCESFLRCLTSQVVPTAALTAQGSRGFYIRAYRASLPLHAPDMLAVRIQAIDGAGTFTQPDSQPCRLLPPANASTPPSRVAPHVSGPLWFGRVRWWHGSGLRMMPTFPPPPLSFRTVSFPQYGWKVGLSGSAFPRVTQVKPAPGIPGVSRRFASALRALRGHTLRPALCRYSGLGGALPFEKIPPLPQRSSLRSGVYCPGPSSLIRPHPPHSQAHSDFTACRLIRNAFAVRVRLGDPRVVPCFCCMFPLAMPSSTTAGTPLAVGAQFLRQRHWPSPELERLGTPKKPHHLLPMGRTFAASLLRYSLRPAQLLATLADRTGYFSQPTAAFPSRLSTGRSPFPPLDITTVATQQVPPAGLSPAGTSASIAAPTPSTYETFIHNTLPV